jgi:hypothetical protein
MSRIKLYPAVVYRTARAKGYEEVRAVAYPTLAGARYLAPRGSHKHGSGRPVSGPRLADSFGMRWSERINLITVEIYNSADYASTVAIGSGPHTIRPKSKRFLMFEWPRGEASPRMRRRMYKGKFLFKKVRHPGNKRPVRYLQTPLAMYGRSRNFRVVTVPNSRSRFP